MAFDITQFKAEFSARGGPMRTNRFQMTFPTPLTMLGAGNTAINRSLEFWCDSVSFTGFLIGTHDVRRWTYGPVEKRPNLPNFTQLQCTFINDAENEVWMFFNNWMQSIMPHNAVDGINTQQSGGMVYELAYKQQYATDLNIILYNEMEEVSTRLVCREAFPSQLPDVPLNWSDINGVFRFQVIFDFLDWHVNPRQ